VIIEPGYLFILFKFVDPKLCFLKALVICEIVTDDGCTGSAVVDTTHRFVAFTSGSILTKNKNNLHNDIKVFSFKWS